MAAKLHKIVHRPLFISDIFLLLLLVVNNYARSNKEMQFIIRKDFSGHVPVLK